MRTQARRRGAAMALAALGALAAGAGPAFAQESRAEQIARAQAEKVPAPYETLGAERFIRLAEQLLGNPPTFYPWFGSVYPGGSFAAGGGIRKPYGDTGLFDIHVGQSVSNYRLLDARLELPRAFDDRLRFDLGAQWIDAPGVTFYGVGQSSPADSRTRYDYQPTTFAVNGSFRAAKRFSFGAGLGYYKGAAALAASVEERYVQSRLFAAFDSRTSPGYTDRGGFYQVEWTDHHPQGSGGHGVQRLDVEAQRFFPIVRANWVVALRALATVTNTEEGGEIPYFLLPDLGGSKELRGYPSWRFRDRNRMLLTAEYRWKTSQFVDMVLFLDSGKVTPRASEFSLEGLATTYGVGIRFHAPTATVLRVEMARTREGYGLIFSAGQAF